MTTLVTTQIANVSALNAWWAALPNDAVSADKQYVALLAAGVYADVPNMTGKTSDNSAVDVGYGKSRIVVTPDAGVWVPNSADPLRYDETKGVCLRLAGWNEDWQGQDGLSLRKLQLTSVSSGNASITARGPVEQCICFFNTTKKPSLQPTTVFINCVIYSQTLRVYAQDSGSRLIGCVVACFDDLTPINSADWLAVHYIDTILLNLSAAKTANSWTGSANARYGASSSNNAGNAPTGEMAGANCITIDPSAVFENVASIATVDFRLKAGASVIGAGIANVNLAQDIFGTTRQAPPSIGPVDGAGATSTDATADGVTLTGAATLTPGTATGGSGGVDATAEGVTLTGIATLMPGTATGGASGSFVSSPMYSSGILQASVALDWTWYPGAIGAAPTAALVHGSGATAGDGTLTMPSLPAGAGFYLAEGLDLNGEVLVALEYGTVT